MHIRVLPTMVLLGPLLFAGAAWPGPPAAAPPATAAATTELDAALQTAREALRAERYDEAMDGLFRLWTATHGPSARGDVATIMPDVKMLVSRYEPAQTQLADRRERFLVDIEGATAQDWTIVEWADLNQALGEVDAMIAWYEEKRGDPKKRRLSERVEPAVFAAVARDGRWSDAGNLFASPLETAERRLLRLSILLGQDRPDERLRAVIAQYTATARPDVARMYAACLAADRDDEAESIASLLLQTLDDGETRAELVRWALEAGEPRQAQLFWLQQAAEKGTDVTALNERLMTALAD